MVDVVRRLRFRWQNPAFGGTAMAEPRGNSRSDGGSTRCTWKISSDIIVKMSDVLIRDIPDDVLAGIDSHAEMLGLSRVEYIRRRLAQDARTAHVPVSREDLQRFGAAVTGLADEDLMREAWR